MRNFRELEVWQRAHRLTLDVYRDSAEFPKAEMFGLTSQMRRAAASVGANIAEGAGKFSGAELLRYLQIASGSASELENHLILARDLGFLEDERFGRLERDIQDVKMMITRFVQHLRRESGKQKAEV